MSRTHEPIVSFHRLIPGIPAPERADRSGHGILPTRAYRYCDAVTTAAGFGWHLYAPISFSLFWDGDEVLWTTDGLEAWLPLGAAQFPHFSARFDDAAPEDVKGFSPPFLTALPEPGVVQMWTGYFARSAPGWSLLLRAPANLPRQPGFEPYEGIIETDRWFGPIFTNLRLTRTGVQLDITPDRPLLQVQPIPQIAYADAVLNGPSVRDALEEWDESEWDAYRASIVAPSTDPDPTPGRYAIEARKRRRGGVCPYAGLAKAAEAVAG